MDLIRDRAIVVTCMRCKHEGILLERDLSRFGLAPGASIVSFVKRLRCTRCGTRSVMATRQTAPKRRA